MKPNLSFEEYTNEWLCGQLSRGLMYLFVKTKKIFPNTSGNLNTALHRAVQQARTQVRISNSASLLVKALASCKPGVDTIIFDQVKVEKVIDLATSPLPQIHCPAEYYHAMANGQSYSSNFGFSEFEALVSPILNDVRMACQMVADVPAHHFSRLWSIRRAFLLLDFWMIALDQPNPIRGSVGYARGLGSEIVSLNPQMGVVVVYNSQAT